VTFQGLHVNLNIFNKLPVWTQLNLYSGTLLIWIFRSVFMGKLRMQMDVWTHQFGHVYPKLNTCEYGVHDTVMYLNDCVAKNSDGLDILAVRSGPNTVNTLKD